MPAEHDNTKTIDMSRCQAIIRMYRSDIAREPLCGGQKRSTDLTAPQMYEVTVLFWYLSLKKNFTFWKLNNWNAWVLCAKD